MVKPGRNYSIPLLNTFAGDCFAGPIPLITDIFYENHPRSCTHGTKEIRWKTHMAKDGALSERHLNFDCPAGGTNQCVDLPADWVVWRHNKLICDATQPGSDDASVLMRAFNSFYLPASAGVADQACCDTGGASLTAAVPALKVAPPLRSCLLYP